MKIYVGGSLRNVPVYGELCGAFVERFGQRIVERDHLLLTGCRGSLDQAIAEAAAGWLESQEKDIRKRIVSYRLKNDEPVHRLGRIQVSKRVDWALTTPDLNPPEQIAEADVTVFVAGSEGTYHAANWARIAGKPILGVAQFGGAGADLFERERDGFAQRFSHLAALEDYGMLNQDTDDVDQLAEDVLTLCESLMTANTVFVIMSFKKEFDDLYAAFKTVCESIGFEAVRIDEDLSLERIIPRILERIRRSAFVIADVTDTSPNVFYELGYAEGLGRPVIATAKQGTSLPFDIVDTPVRFWTDLEDLKGKLLPILREVKSGLGKGSAPPG